MGTTTTSAAGAAGFFIPIPNVPALINQDFFAQWGAATPTGGFALATQTFALSNARRVLIW